MFKSLTKNQQTDRKINELPKTKKETGIGNLNKGIALTFLK